MLLVVLVGESITRWLELYRLIVMRRNEDMTCSRSPTMLFNTTQGSSGRDLACDLSPGDSFASASVRHSDVMGGATYSSAYPNG